VIELPVPRYPTLSRRRGEQGLVVLEVEVLADGRVGHVRVVQSPGYRRLEQAAIDAVRQAAFQPARARNRPVASVVRIPFRFVIR
jgi:protein TonB